MPDPSDRGPYFSSTQVAEMLGVHVDTVRRVYLRPAGDLPSYRLGSGPRAAVRIAKADLDDWIERHRDDPAPPPTATPRRRRRRSNP